AREGRPGRDGQGGTALRAVLSPLLSEASSLHHQYRKGPRDPRRTARRAVPTGPYRRNGFVRRSCPIVVVGPWPGYTTQSSPRGSSTSLIDRSSVAWSPPGRSVLPTDPA